MKFMGKLDKISLLPKLRNTFETYFSWFIFFNFLDKTMQINGQQQINNKYNVISGSRANVYPLKTLFYFRRNISKDIYLLCFTYSNRLHSSVLLFSNSEEYAKNYFRAEYGFKITLK